MSEAQTPERQNAAQEETTFTPTSPQPSSDDTPDTRKEEGGSGIKYLIYAIVALIAIVLIGSLIAIIIALADPGAAEKIGAVRDVFIIVLTWFSMLIGLAFIILILQFAALINLLKNEVIPILESLQTTADTVRGTTRFMSRNLAQPVIRATGFFAYLRYILEALRIVSAPEPPDLYEAEPPGLNKTEAE